MGGAVNHLPSEAGPRASSLWRLNPPTQTEHRQSLAPLGIGEKGLNTTAGESPHREQGGERQEHMLGPGETEVGSLAGGGVSVRGKDSKSRTQR